MPIFTNNIPRVTAQQVSSSQDCVDTARPSSYVPIVTYMPGNYGTRLLTEINPQSNVRLPDNVIPLIMARIKDMPTLAAFTSSCKKFLPLRDTEHFKKALEAFATYKLVIQIQKDRDFQRRNCNLL